MNCNVDVFCKLISSNKFGFILETVFSYSCKKFCSSCPNMSEKLTSHLPLHSNDENARGKKFWTNLPNFFFFRNSKLLLAFWAMAHLTKLFSLYTFASKQPSLTFLGKEGDSLSSLRCSTLEVNSFVGIWPSRQRKTL
jgi:hypothetical protein